jgi:hypothetical protein
VDGLEARAILGGPAIALQEAISFIISLEIEVTIP